MSVKIVKKKKNIGKKLIKWLPKFIVLFFILYVAFVLVNQHIKINDKQKHLSRLSSQLALQKVKNEELKKISQTTDENNKEYFEKEARKLNLSKPKERIFANISGN